MRMCGLRLWVVMGVLGALLVGVGPQVFAAPVDSQSPTGRIDEATRTHSRALLADGSGGILESSAARSSLPYASPSVTDGFRYIDMPSFNDWYSLTLQSVSSGADGSSAIVHHNNEGGMIDAKITPGAVEHFHMPTSAYRALVQRVDALVSGWNAKADGQVCMDGVIIAFERVRAGQVLTGVGNASCSDHYAQLESIVFEAVGPYLHAVQMPCLAAKPSYQRVCAAPATQASSSK